MEGCALLVVFCINHCSCFHEHATDFSMSLLRSEMEGRGLLVSLCPDRCSCFHEHATDFSMPIVCSKMEGRTLVAIPDFYKYLLRPPLIYDIHQHHRFSQPAGDPLV
jgi:hypothetical protein